MEQYKKFRIVQHNGISRRLVITSFGAIHEARGWLYGHACKCAKQGTAPHRYTGEYLAVADVAFSIEVK